MPNLIPGSHSLRGLASIGTSLPGEPDQMQLQPPPLRLLIEGLPDRSECIAGLPIIGPASQLFEKPLVEMGTQIEVFSSSGQRHQMTGDRAMIAGLRRVFPILNDWSRCHLPREKRPSTLGVVSATICNFAGQHGLTPVAVFVAAWTPAARCSEAQASCAQPCCRYRFYRACDIHTVMRRAASAPEHHRA